MNAVKSPLSKAFSSFTSTHFLLVGIVTITLGLFAVLYLIQMPQDLRQQASTASTTSTSSNTQNASGCQYNPVNVEFRYADPSDTQPWTSGQALQTSTRKPVVDDSIDVNCFAQNGAILLPGGSYTITRSHEGKVSTYQLPASVFKGHQQVRNWRITEPGTYAFTCKNTTSCSNSDSITVTGKTLLNTTTNALPSTNATATVEPTIPNCPNPSLADINKNCIVDLHDFDLFLQEFTKMN